MDTSIELRYAGVVIGRATAVGEIAGDSLFLSIADPLPVGTKVSLTIDDRVVEGRVVGVSESSDLTKCGMKVRVNGASAPEPKALPEPAPAVTPPAAVAAASTAVTAPAHAPTAVAEVSAAADSSSSAPATPAVEARAPVEEIGPEPSGALVEGVNDAGGGSDDSPGPSGGGGGGGGGGGRRRRRKR